MRLRWMPPRDVVAEFIHRNTEVFARIDELERMGIGEGLEVKWIAGDGSRVSVLADSLESDPARSLLEVLAEKPPER